MDLINDKVRIAHLFTDVIKLVSALKPCIDATGVFSNIKQELQRASECIVMKKDLDSGISILTNTLSQLASFKLIHSRYEDKREQVCFMVCKIVKLTYGLKVDNDDKQKILNDYNIHTNLILEMKREINELRDRVKALENGTK